MVISVAIQTHPGRLAMAEVLRDECLGGQAEIVLDPEPDISPPSPWRTYRRCLLETPLDATHRLIIQEDVIVADGLLDALPKIVAVRPDRVICLFVAGHPVQYAHAMREAAYFTHQPFAELIANTWIPVVATIWPADLGRDCVRWADEQFARRWPPVFTADDEICGRYLRECRGLYACATVPSIVEHPDTEDSLVRRRIHDGTDQSRRAMVWIEDMGLCDASGIVWE